MFALTIKGQMFKEAQHLAALSENLGSYCVLSSTKQESVHFKAYQMNTILMCQKALLILIFTLQLFDGKGTLKLFLFTDRWE